MTRDYRLRLKLDSEDDSGVVLSLVYDPIHKDLALELVDRIEHLVKELDEIVDSYDSDEKAFLLAKSQEPEPKPADDAPDPMSGGAISETNDAPPPKTTPQKQRKPGAGRRQSVWNDTYNRWIKKHTHMELIQAWAAFNGAFPDHDKLHSQFKRQYYKIKSRLYRSTLPAPVEEQPPQPEVPDVIEDIAIQPHPPFKIDDKVRLKQPHNHTGIGIVNEIKDNHMRVEFDAGTIWVHKDAVIKVE